MLRMVEPYVLVSVIDIALCWSRSHLPICNKPDEQLETDPRGNFVLRRVVRVL
jgi:hypothetical protein